MTTCLSRRSVVGGALKVAGLMMAGSAGAQQGVIRVGELNSYGRMAAFCIPYRNAMQMAVDEINQAGGVLGSKLEFIFRDDGATPADASRVADELVNRDKVALLLGTFLSNVGLAVADYAHQKKVLFLATEPLSDAITLAQGNRYTFRVRPSTYMQTKALVDVVAAKGVKKWAIIAPNYEYGQSAAANFKKLMAAAVPGFEVVAEQYPALGKIDAGVVATAIEQAKPEGIFNVTFGADLTQLVREGNTRGLFEKRTVVSLLTGEPEYLLPLGAETPEGWIVTGYPWEQIDTPAHKAFVAAYQKRYGETPRVGSFLGYVVGYMVRDLLLKAGSTETEAMVTALEGLKFETIAGAVQMRALDHQSTLGCWVGETTRKDGAGAMKNVRYIDGASVLVPEDVVKATRKG